MSKFKVGDKVLWGIEGSAKIPAVVTAEPDGDGEDIYLVLVDDGLGKMVANWAESNGMEPGEFAFENELEAIER